MGSCALAGSEQINNIGNTINGLKYRTLILFFQIVLTVINLNEVNPELALRSEFELGFVGRLISNQSEVLFTAFDKSIKMRVHRHYARHQMLFGTRSSSGIRSIVRYNNNHFFSDGNRQPISLRFMIYCLMIGNEIEY